MAFPKELAKQRRDAIPGRARVVARVPQCQSIKCPYTGAGAWTTCVQEPSSEAVLAEGALSPRARRAPFVGVSIPRATRTSPEGVLSPRARRTSPEGALSLRVRRGLLVGASDPRARQTPPEGSSAVPPRRAAGATRVVIVTCVCFRFVG
jgi:hypothetical protein